MRRREVERVPEEGEGGSLGEDEGGEVGPFEGEHTVELRLILERGNG